MDPTELTNLLPLGGASVLLIYLLRIIGYERTRWIRERSTLITECREALALKDEDLARREREHERHLRQWQERYEVARADYERLLEAHTELERRIAELERRRRDSE